MNNKDVFRFYAGIMNVFGMIWSTRESTVGISTSRREEIIGCLVYNTHTMQYRTIPLSS